MTTAFPARPRPAQVPVLTEVIEVQAPASMPPKSSGSAPPSVAAPVTTAQGPEPSLASPAPPVPSEQQIVNRVMQDVQRQIDGMLDYRLREAMAPVLARHADALVQELRQELSRTLRDVVNKAVSQELAKWRQR